MKINPNHIEKFESDYQPVQKIKKKKSENPEIKDKKRLKKTHRQKKES
jgi:hypothetical protein